MKLALKYCCFFALFLLALPLSATIVASEPCLVVSDPDDPADPDPADPDIDINTGNVTVFFVGGGPRVTGLDFMDPRQEGEARFAAEADFVKATPEQPYACLEKATALSTLVMESSRALAPGAILVPVRVQNCAGELFKDASGADIDPMAVARWIQENAKSPSVVVFGFSRNAKAPALGELIRALRADGITVVPPASGRSEEALVAHMLRAGREIAVFQDLLGMAKAGTCASNGGINQGGLTPGIYNSPTFPCNDAAARSQAIQNLLAQMGYTQTLCSGTCSTGTCKTIGLTSGLQDNVDLRLNDNGAGSCSYTATVKAGGVGYFRGRCGCVCNPVVAPPTGPSTTP